MAECPTCGKDSFKTEGGMKKHHSQVHGESLSIVETECDNCGEKFSYQEARAHSGRFCSHECRGEYWSGQRNHFTGVKGEEHPAWRDGQEEVTCRNCGENFTYYTSEKKDGVLCSDECKRQYYSEEGNPNWRGGYEHYYGPSWTDELKESVRERDNRECQDCGINEEELGRKLDVHHKIPFRLFGIDKHRKANQRGNLISLCRSCHNST